MRFKKVCLSLLIFMFLFVTITYANNTETEQIPDINSRAAIVLDRETKSILYEKNSNEIRKMASTTKIMTAIVVIENSNLYCTVTISKKAANTGGSVLGIKEGDKITICDLLYGLLLRSGNDAAVALAENVGGSIEGFAEMMNNKAKDLNLTNTHFVTPHGLDNDNHYTTAYELALLTDYALNNKTFFNFVSTKSYTVTINGAPKSISNTNELLGSLNGVYGVKTGFTNGANRCLVTACKRDNFDIICVVLGADTKNFRSQDSTKLIEYTFKTYEMFDIKKYINSNFEEWRLSNIDIFNIDKGLSDNIELSIKGLNYSLYPIKKADIQNISASIDCNYNLKAPLPSNSKVGTVTVNISKDTILNFDIVNTVYIERKSSLNYFLEILSKFFKYLTISY